MKPISLAMTTLLVVLFLNAPAQTSRKYFEIKAVPEEPPAVNTESKVYKNFHRSHPDVMNDKWRSENNYYVVTFTKNDIKNKIVFTSAGRVDYILRIFQEKHLPAFVRSSVKSVYYDYSITNVQELTVKNRKIYLVKITDGKAWKTIRVDDDDFEEIEHITST